MSLRVGSFHNRQALGPVNRAGQLNGHGIFFDDADALVLQHASGNGSKLRIGDGLDRSLDLIHADGSLAMTLSDVQHYMNQKTGGSIHWVHISGGEQVWHHPWRPDSEQCIGTLVGILEAMRASTHMATQINVLWDTTLLECSRRESQWVWAVIGFRDDESFTCIDISSRTVHTISAGAQRQRSTMGRLVQWTANVLSGFDEAGQTDSYGMLRCDNGRGLGTTAIDVLYSRQCSWHAVTLIEVLQQKDPEEILLGLDLGIGICEYQIKAGIPDRFVLKPWSQLTADGDVIHIRDPHFRTMALTSAHTGAAINCVRGVTGRDYVYVPPPQPLVSSFRITTIAHHEAVDVTVDGNMLVSLKPISEQQQWLQQNSSETPLHRVLEWRSDSTNVGLHVVTYDGTSILPGSGLYLGCEDAGVRLLGEAVGGIGWSYNERRVLIPVGSWERMSIPKLSLMWHGPSSKWTRAPDNLMQMQQARTCFAELLVTGGRRATNRQTGDIVVTGGVGVHGEIHCQSVVTLSDQSHKRDILALHPDDCLRKVLQWQPSSFCWRDSNQPDTGFIAQDLDRNGSAPHCVRADGSGVLSVNYNAMMAYLAGAVQALAKQKRHGRKKKGRARQRI